MRIIMSKLLFFVMLSFSLGNVYGQFCTALLPNHEYDSLMSFYLDTNGDAWINRHHWEFTAMNYCDWYGIGYLDNYNNWGTTYVESIDLRNNNLVGTISTALSNLTRLEYLNLSGNRLSGPLSMTSFSSELRYLYIGNNHFTFDDLEGVVGYYNDNELAIILFEYSPQAKVDQEETVTLDPGGSYTLTTGMQSPNNRYQWQFSSDGGTTFTNIGTDSRTYTISSATSSNSGIYRFVATNSIVHELTLERNWVTVTVGGSDQSADNHFCTSSEVTHNFLFDDEDNVVTGHPTKSFFSITHATNGLLKISSEAYSIFSIEIDGIPNEDLDHEIIDDVWYFYDALDGSGSIYNIKITTDTVITPDILEPSGPTVLWYLSESTTEPLPHGYIMDDEFVNGSLTLWWDDTSDTVTSRTKSVLRAYRVPEGNTEQTFSIYANPAPTLTDIVLQNEGNPIYWYGSSTGSTLLGPNTVLVDGATYYAAACDSADAGCTCRLPVKINFTVLPPNGDAIQYLCENSTLKDITLQTDSGLSIIWYDSETDGTILDRETRLNNGTIYYAAQTSTNGVESQNRLSVLVYILSVSAPEVPASNQYFYINDPRTVGDLLAFGYHISWYDQAVGGQKYDSASSLVDGSIYYAEQESMSGCVSDHRTAVRAVFLDETIEPLLGCELFKPELSGHYIIDAWVNEREVLTETITGVQFNNGQASRLFVGLLNHLKNRLLSSDKDLVNIPAEYRPEFTGGEPILDFGPLMPYIEGLTPSETKLTVYDFKPINDNYSSNGKGRAIGFSFYLNRTDRGTTNRQFIYMTPTFTYSVPKVTATTVEVHTKTAHYPLLDNIGNTKDEFLNFTDVSINGTGQFSISSDFKQVTEQPGSGTYIETSEIGTLSAPNAIKSYSTTFKYTEVAYQAAPTYTQAKIEIKFVDSDNTTIGTPLVFSPKGAIIDKWQKITGDFIIPNNAGKMIVSLQNNDANKIVHFDDLRIHPFASNMKTFVYHPENQRLMSELDENNYATFYEYDPEGGLVRVKKETVKGIYTIQETRSGNFKSGN